MSDLHFNISKEELGRLQLGALKERRLVADDPISGTRVWEFEFEKATVQKTEWYGAGDFLEQAAEQRKESDGKRFGDGRIVASVPMHIWAREVAPRMRDGNQASLRRWLNSSDNRAFRTFEGDI